MSARIYITLMATGEERLVDTCENWDDETSDFLWMEGNYGCDCNRHLFFVRAGDGTESDDRECSHHLYGCRIEVDGVTRHDDRAETAAELPPMTPPPTRFHPSEFLKDELEARGWSIDYLAIRMHWPETALSILEIELYFALGSGDAESAKGCNLSADTAARVESALGIEHGLIDRLRALWESHREREAFTEPPTEPGPAEQ